MAISQPPPPGPRVTEILYNLPGTADDSLEFVELYSTWEHDISGWYFSSGIDFVFPDSTFIGPNSFLFVAADSVAFQNNFGLNAFQWENSTLSDSGECLWLATDNGYVPDPMCYEIGNPWPVSSTSAGLHSIGQYFLSTSNIHPETWCTSNSLTNVEVAGIPIYADPGQYSGCFPVGADLLDQNHSMMVYPNPTTGFFTIGFPSHVEGRLDIYDSRGKRVYTLNTMATKTPLSIEQELPKGVYHVLWRCRDETFAKCLVVLN